MYLKVSKLLTRNLQIVIALLLPLFLAKAGFGWEMFKWQEARCAADFPGKPNFIQQEVKTADGTVIPLQIYSYSEPGFGVYLMAASDIPSGNNVTKEQRLDGARDGAAKNVNGKITREIRTSIAGHPGRVFDIYIPGKELEIRQKVILVNRRLYQIAVVGAKKGNIKSERATRFLASFALTE